MPGYQRGDELEPSERPFRYVVPAGGVDELIAFITSEVELRLIDAMLDILDWAGRAVQLPEAVDGLCCGMAFASKGLHAAARTAAERTAEVYRRVGEILSIAYAGDGQHQDTGGKVVLANLVEGQSTSNTISKLSGETDS